MFWVVGALVVIVVFVMAFGRHGGLSSLVDRAIADRDTSPLVTHIAAQAQSVRPTVFDQAVRSLWERYERGLAARLVRDAVEHLAGASIGQFWIRQVMEIEPEVSREVFDEGFLTASYRPEVAAACGKFG